VAHSLQDHYFNPLTGQYNGGSLWTDAVSIACMELGRLGLGMEHWINCSFLKNTLEDLHNLMLATGTDDFSTVADNSYIGRIARSGTNWASVLGGSNDDALVGTVS